MIFDWQHNQYFQSAVQVVIVQAFGAAVVLGEAFYFNLMLVTEQSVRSALNVTGQSARSGLLTTINIREDLDA